MKDIFEMEWDCIYNVIGILLFILSEALALTPSPHNSVLQFIVNLMSRRQATDIELVRS